ncbi:MAG TPA: peroxiredoxin [Acidobacteriaceae bacterium]|nr:peroxiredoxin [Acidobacteriaceae bacterium]
MLKISLVLVAVVVVVLGGLAVRSFADYGNGKMPQVGEMAPNFTLPSEKGTDVSLDSLRGKWVVLYFYPADMTPGCTIEAHNFEHDLSRYKTLNAEIVGISVQSVASHKKFCAKDNLTFTLLSDTGKKVVSEYGSLGNYMGFKIANRNTFLIDPEGKIVKVWTKVDPAHHSQEVLAALHEFEKR